MYIGRGALVGPARGFVHLREAESENLFGGDFCQLTAASRVLVTRQTAEFMGFFVPQEPEAEVKTWSSPC